MNIADEIYILMYDIVVVRLLPTLTTVIQNIASTGYFRQISAIAVMVVGLLMIYGKMNRQNFVKSILSIFIVYSLLLNVQGNIYLLEALRSLFIDGPIEFGSVIVNTIASVIYGDSGITNQTINIQPSPDGTAFGKLWEISTDLAGAVWDSGGLSDIGAFFIGAGLYLVAIFLLVFQILMLGTFLIMAAAAIYGAPLFIPMVLFKSTRPMFQSWIGFGLSGGFGLIFLMIMMGIIFGFIAITFFNVFGIDLSTGNVGDIEDISDMDKIGAMIVFMLISIKLLPKVEMWASSLAGASAAGISDVTTAIGGQIAQKTGLAAQKTGKAVNNNVVKPTGGAIKRGLGRTLDRFRNKSGNQGTGENKASNAKQSLANARLKKAIRDRLINRGQNPKRPLAQLSNKEQGIAKRQTLQNKKSSGSSGIKNTSTTTGLRGLNQNVKQSSKTSNSNKSDQSIKKESSDNKSESSNGKQGSATERPLVNDRSGNKESSSRTVEKQSSEKSTVSNNESKHVSSSSPSSFEKSSVTGSQSSSNTTNPSSSQRTGDASSKSKSVDRDSNIKEKGKREQHKKQLESMQQEQNIKRRDSDRKTKKKKEDEEK